MKVLSNVIWLRKIIKKNLDNYFKGKSFMIKPIDNITKSLINEGSKELVGNAFRRGGSMYPLGGSLNSNQFVGIS